MSSVARIGGACVNSVCFQAILYGNIKHDKRDIMDYGMRKEILFKTLTQCLACFKWDVTKMLGE